MTEPSEAELSAATVAAGDFIYQGPGPQPMELQVRARDCARAVLIAARNASHPDAERARALEVLKNAGIVTTELVDALAAALQSEREATAAEARRAAIGRLEALRDGKFTDVPGCNDKWTLDNAIKALASPPAPQESDAQRAYREGMEAGKQGKSAKDNPYLSGPNYLANAWWKGCASPPAPQED